MPNGLMMLINPTNPNRISAIRLSTMFCDPRRSTADGFPLGRDEPSVVVWLDGGLRPTQMDPPLPRGRHPLLRIPVAPGFSHVESYRGAAFVRHPPRSEFVAQCNIA
jgi:hypothetical protein